MGRGKGAARKLKRVVLIAAVVLIAWQLTRHGSHYGHQHYIPHVTRPRHAGH